MAAGNEKTEAAVGTVFLLVRNELARQELRHLLEHAGMQVVGECSSARRALARIRALAPDVTVLDSSIADGRGIEVCLQARESVPGLGCVVLVSYPYEAEGPGAEDCEFVLRTVVDHGLLEAVRRAAAPKGPAPGGGSRDG